MKINIIAAVANNRAIGYRNNLIYHISADLKRFKALTTGHTIIMGRNTFLSLPKGALPNRRNIVLSTTVSQLPGCEVYSSLDEALGHCSLDEARSHGLDDDEVYIIGGAHVYRQALERADQLCLTEIDDTPAEADCFFPEYREEWVPVLRECHAKDEKNPHDFSFVDYRRKD